MSASPSTPSCPDMATSLPGPLVSSVHGVIGGVQFRAGQGAQIIGAKPIIRARRTRAQTAVRLAIARAALAWANLSAADRLAWESYASSVQVSDPLGTRQAPSAFNLFCASRALTQPQAFTPAAPPFTPGQNAPLLPITQLTGGSLYLSGYSRALAAPEDVLWRVSLDANAARKQPPPQALRSITTNNTQGLADVDGRAWRKTTAGAALSRTGSISTATSHTIEVWLFSYQAAATARGVFRNTAALFSCTLATNTLRFGFQSAAGFFESGAFINDAAWHHYAWVANGATSLTTFFFDGIATGSTVAYTPQTLSGNSSIAGYDAGGTAGMTAAYDEFVMWDSARTPAQILASYNTGRGRRYTSADGARLILHLDTIAGGTTPDDSGNNLTFTATLGALELSAFSRLIMSATETRYPGGNLWLYATPSRPSQPRAMITRSQLPAP